MIRRNFFVITILMLATYSLVACSLLFDDSADPTISAPTLTPRPTEPVEPAPRTAETAALTFYRSWELGDYDAMYSWLSPRSQGLVPLEDFVRRYEEAVNEVRVTEVLAQPQAAAYEGNSAEMIMRVIWKTAVVGDIVRDHTVPLAYEGGRWAVVWDESLIMPELVGGNYLQLKITPPARGNLLDVNNKLLSFQGSGVVVGVLPMDLEDEEGFLQVMGDLFGITPSDLKALYADVPDNWYVPFGTVSEDVLQENFYILEPYIEKGLQIRRGAGRIYNPEGIAPHLIGYMGYIPESATAEYWARGYNADARVGITGLEQSAEEYLSGTHGGVLSLISPSGEALELLQEVQTQQGRDVHTTFDGDFQLAVQNALAEAIVSYGAGQAGAVVVLDVNTGAVKAMASYPTFDLSAFSEIREDAGNTLAQLLDDPNRPLYNRASQGEYPPGSTFKMVTVASGMASGLFSADTRYFCNGVWEEAGPNLFKTDWLEGGHGSLTLQQGLTGSCNPYMYHIGYALENSNQFALPEMARGFGLGKPTQILGAPESVGAIPDPEWIINTYGTGWSPGDSVNMAIGQGYVLATPLQIANMTAAIANGGALYRPTLIDRIAPAQGVPEQIIQPEVIGEVPIAPEHMRTIQQGMMEVTSNPTIGTAWDRFIDFPYASAGKTGTAESPGLDTAPHAWYTGYLPTDAPEIAITVLVENGGGGYEIAAPIFRRIAELYYDLEPLPFYWQPTNAE